jgi:hypothetical protein
VVNGVCRWHVCASVKYLGDAHGHSASSNVPCLCSEIANDQACGYPMLDALRGTISISCRSSSFGTATVRCSLARLVIGWER